MPLPPNPNPLLVDYRVGSKDLYPKLIQIGAKAVLAKPPAELLFGDCCWAGNGPEGTVEVGVERKNVYDFVSSMRENRLGGHQVKGMVEIYDIRYLLLEGEWTIQDGTVWAQNKWKVWKPVKPGTSRVVSAGEMVGFISALVNQAGFNLIRTSGDVESAYWLRYYWGWWQKPWDEHEALGIGGVGGMFVGGKGMGRMGKVGLVDTDLGWELASRLPGLGLKRSKEIAHQFSTARGMARFIGKGEVEDWEKLEGVGKAGARKIVEAVDRQRRKRR